jgi:hypothetical protein
MQVLVRVQTVVHRSTISGPVKPLNRSELPVPELTMRSWHLLYDLVPEAYAAAKSLLERVLAIDPESAEAKMVLSPINHHVAILVVLSIPISEVERMSVRGAAKK